MRHPAVASSIPAMPLDPQRVLYTASPVPFVTLEYDRLTRMNGTEVAPMLATGWEFAPDGTSTTFTLRQDVTVSDGTRLDAAAVKASLDRALGPGSTVRAGLAMIVDVDLRYVGVAR